MSTIQGIQEVFTDFLVANFALYSKVDEQSKSLSNDELQKLTVDFVQPHECARRLDLLLRLKEEVIDREPADEPEEVLFFLKVARVLNFVMQTTCPSLEERIAKYNSKIAASYCDAYFDEIQVEKANVLSIILRRDKLSETGDGPSSNGKCLGRIEFLEWLLINVSIWAESIAYFNATKFLEMACKFCGIEIGFHGQLGRRTRFQEKSLPQLVLKPNQVKKIEWNFENKPVPLPKNIENKDDTVLNKLAFDENINTDSLDIAQVSCILAATWLKVREDAFIDLRFEVVDALVNTILDQKNVGFSMVVSTLILRSEAERLNTRRIERACQQTESLVSELENHENLSITAGEARLRVQDLFLTSPMQPVWAIKKFHAKVLMSLALTSEAIGVLESVCDWEKVIECYSILNMKEKALGILETLQEKHPDNPFYLCMIGEIRRDEKLLNRVIEMTGDKYPKAHKILGFMALEAKDYQKSFKHLKRVFELSPLAIQAVYNYGVSALEIGEIKNAITAFHHCVSVDPENYRAWNNLAAAYVQSNQKARAVQVLNQGLRVHNESDKMWSNLFELAAELPSKRECLIALKRYLQFNPKQINLQPLMQIILTNTNAAKGTFYPSPPIQDPLSSEELKLLVECLEGAHKISTLGPMALRLMAYLQKPSENETDPKVFEHFIELMDLAENRELKGGTERPDYANVLKALMDIYETRCRYATLMGKDIKALNKIIRYRIKPILTRIGTEIGGNLDNDENAALRSVIAEANALLLHFMMKTTSSKDVDIEKLREEAKGRVIRLKQIPFGFFDFQILQFFSQFGTVKRVRVPRTKKGHVKRIAFVYFAEPEVARIASESMDNYLMFDSRVQSTVLTEDIPPTILSGPRVLKFTPLPDRAKKALAKKMCAKKSDEEKKEFKEKLAQTIDKSLERLKKSGYKYKFAFKHKL
ncbi:hypothetical protein M3Y97_00090300 [Aphelenchoides bicaudatus]|nr:hypothetical protein M3Y97_00090300 [Aphelenchoides bicaudatus]